MIKQLIYRWICLDSPEESDVQEKRDGGLLEHRFDDHLQIGAAQPGPNLPINRFMRVHL